MQWLRLWDVSNAIHIYGWWVIVCWPFELVLGSLHVFGLGHIIQILLSNRHTRVLNPTEMSIAHSIFADKINYALVRLHGKSRISKKFRIAFVTANQINFARGMSYNLFIHEMTHVYQYQRVGLVYIPRCLMAQYSREGYDFGTVEQHWDIIRGEAKLNKLNYEQQAEFIETIYGLSSQPEAIHVQDFTWINL